MTKKDVTAKAIGTDGKHYTWCHRQDAYFNETDGKWAEAKTEKLTEEKLISKYNLVIPTDSDIEIQEGVVQCTIWRDTKGTVIGAMSDHGSVFNCVDWKNIDWTNPANSKE
jgi:hypothetical protein